MSGEFWTRLSVWMALVGYLAGPLAALLGRQHPTWQRAARAIYTAGLLFFLAHVALAFHVFYDWSHIIALRETARETLEVTGRQSGAGLYLNYLFTLLWIVDALWWWRRPESFERRNPWIAVTLHGFMLFMAFNATVVFEEGAVRWAGVLGTVLLVTALVPALVQAAKSRGARAQRASGSGTLVP